MFCSPMFFSRYFCISELQSWSQVSFCSFCLFVCLLDCICSLYIVRLRFCPGDVMQLPRRSRKWPEGSSPSECTVTMESQNAAIGRDLDLLFPDLSVYMLECPGSPHGSALWTFQDNVRGTENEAEWEFLSIFNHYNLLFFQSYVLCKIFFHC